VACHCRQQARRQARGSQTQLSGWLVEATFDNYQVTPANRAAWRAARDLASSGHGWLTLWGGYGPGKTHLLAATVNAAQPGPAWYFTLPDLLDRLRSSYRQDDYDAFFGDLCAVPLLALDEVDRANLTDWAGEKIYQLIEARYRHLAERASLFALNRDPQAMLKQDLEAPLAYLYSRMLDQRARLVRLAAPDARPVSGNLWRNARDENGREIGA
jgi:DNA replication protein DnaC